MHCLRLGFGLGLRLCLWLRLWIWLRVRVCLCDVSEMNFNFSSALPQAPPATSAPSHWQKQQARKQNQVELISKIMAAARGAASYCRHVLRVVLLVVVAAALRGCKCQWQWQWTVADSKDTDRPDAARRL